MDGAAVRGVAGARHPWPSPTIGPFKAIWGHCGSFLAHFRPVLAILGILQPLGLFWAISGHFGDGGLAVVAHRVRLQLLPGDGLGGPVGVVEPTPKRFPVIRLQPTGFLPFPCLPNVSVIFRKIPAFEVLLSE